MYEVMAIMAEGFNGFNLAHTSHIIDVPKLVTFKPPILLGL